jgi:hypothetical protein
MYSGYSSSTGGRKPWMCGGLGAEEKEEEDQSPSASSLSYSCPQTKGVGKVWRLKCGT